MVSWPWAIVHIGPSREEALSLEYERRGLLIEQGHSYLDTLSGQVRVPHTGDSHPPGGFIRSEQVWRRASRGEGATGLWSARGTRIHTTSVELTEPLFNLRRRSEGYGPRKRRCPLHRPLPSSWENSGNSNCHGVLRLALQ